MAQIHYKVANDEGKPKYARYGYFFIIIFFTVLLIGAFLASAWFDASVGYAIEYFHYGASTILLLGLYKKARSLYNVKGNCCADCCGVDCCPDACSDCCDAVICSPCSIARLGHHVFNYDHETSVNGVITYEPLATDFDPLGDSADMA